MNQKQARLLCDLINVATDDNWPYVRLWLLAACEYSEQEILEATEALSELAGCSPIITRADLEGQAEYEAAEAAGGE